MWLMVSPKNGQSGTYSCRGKPAQISTIIHSDLSGSNPCGSEAFFVKQSRIRSRVSKSAMRCLLVPAITTY